jgi:hypothetical protein
MALRRRAGDATPAPKLARMIHLYAAMALSAVAPMGPCPSPRFTNLSREHM